MDTLSKPSEKIGVPEPALLISRLKGCTAEVHISRRQSVPEFPAFCVPEFPGRASIMKNRIGEKYTHNCAETNRTHIE